VLRCLSEARTLPSLREQIPQALEIVRTSRRYLQDGHATVEELAITKSLSKEPQAYRHQTLSMIAAQELLARGVSLQAGDTIHYIITDADAAYPPDRRAEVAGLDGTWSYDVSAYDNLLLKAAPRAVDAPRRDGDLVERIHRSYQPRCTWLGRWQPSQPVIGGLVGCVQPVLIVGPCLRI